MVDLGCGDGALTSAAGRAARRGRCARARLLAGDARTGGRRGPATVCGSNGATWPSGRQIATYDLVLANASLQWVPDHETVLARWAAALGPGGQLGGTGAGQRHPCVAPRRQRGRRHRAVPRQRWAAPCPSIRRRRTCLPRSGTPSCCSASGSRPARAIAGVSPRAASSADVVEWVRGTNLNRFFERLPADLHEPFVDAYRTRCSRGSAARAVPVRVQAHPDVGATAELSRRAGHGAISRGRRSPHH